MPEPEPARMAIWLDNRLALSVTGSPSAPRSYRRPIGMKRSEAEACGGAGAEGGARGALGCLLLRASAEPGVATALAVSPAVCDGAGCGDVGPLGVGRGALGLSGFSGGGEDKNGGGHSPACWNTAVSNRGRFSRSQASKPARSRFSMARSAMNARRSSSVGAINLPPAFRN